MYGDQRCPEFINGMHHFLNVAKLKKLQNGLYFVHVMIVGIRGITLAQEPYTPTCCEKASCQIIFVGPSTEKQGL